MRLQSLRNQIPESEERGKNTEVRREVFAPHAEDHIPKSQRRHGRTRVSAPRSCFTLATQSSFRTRDELLQRHRRCMYNFCRCAAQHIQLALNASPSQQS
jgi:hypothetical protein